MSACAKASVKDLYIWKKKGKKRKEKDFKTMLFPSPSLSFHPSILVLRTASEDEEKASEGVKRDPLPPEGEVVVLTLV